MGEIATRLADSVFVTSDNPRGEDPLVIIDQIIAQAHPNYRVEIERAAAIRQALCEARPEDLVLIAGKGHEAYQEIAGRRLPFSDAEVACRVLEQAR
jgi:UDP-N-acetylmuramoyl-L-alanyl-D-glutamate--2,6-diaminopimelate ligase